MLCGVENPNSALKGNARSTRVWIWQGTHEVVTCNTYCCLWSGHTRKRSNSLSLSSISNKVGTRCRSLSYERFLEGCSSPFMRFAEHLTAHRA